MGNLYFCVVWFEMSLIKKKTNLTIPPVVFQPLSKHTRFSFFRNKYFTRKKSCLEAYSMVATMVEGLEIPIQLVYIGLLFSLSATLIGSFTTQLVIRRELDEAAKTVADRINSKSVSASDYFEMGAILTKKIICAGVALFTKMHQALGWRGGRISTGLQCCWICSRGIKSKGPSSILFK